MKLSQSVRFTVECLPEDSPVRGNLIDSGDKLQDEVDEDEVLKQLDRGNQWAWCTVKVTARVNGTDIKATDFLGCCSYESLEDFEASGALDDMKSNALSELKEKLSLIQCLDLDA